jgi:hypothetical protein
VRFYLLKADAYKLVDVVRFYFSQFSQFSRRRRRSTELKGPPGAESRKGKQMKGRRAYATGFIIAAAERKGHGPKSCKFKRNEKKRGNV